MIYLSVENRGLKALYCKKSILGQYDINFFQKRFHLNLIENGKIINTDVLASAIKEILHNLLSGQNKDREIILLLPQNTFRFLRTEIPLDVAPSAIDSFIRDKIRVDLSVNSDDYYYDNFAVNSINQREINIFLLEKEILNRYRETFKLLDIKIINIVPDTLAFFKLFEKTLRKEKKEIILYADYNKENLCGYFYDSYGLIKSDQWCVENTGKKQIEEALKEQSLNYEKEGKKINRLILSGEESENVRQDTFTKNVGMWTNPLKRIVTNFYQNYLNILITPKTKTFNILSYDGCFGAFIFSQENKNFSLLRKRNNNTQNKSFTFPKIKFKKEILLFITSFVASFLLFSLLSKTNIRLPSPNLNLINKPTLTPVPPTPTNTPTPTPSFNKETLKIKILNGGGVAGKASEVKDILNKASYQEILTANADNFDYIRTIIQVKKSQTGLFNVLKNDLKAAVSNPKQETLEEANTADTIIIIGQDFK